MDIPTAEELEWLESDSLLPEFEEEEVVEEEYIIEVDAGSKESNLSRRIQGKQSNSFHDPKSTIDHYNPTSHKKFPLCLTCCPDPVASPVHRKRVRSEEKEDDGASKKPVLDGEERGIKRRELDDDGEEEDEDWLRHSPPPKETVADATTTESDQPMSEAAAEEKIISRFASEIEGDCIPVTGPSGDRVYAKMSLGVGDVDGGGQRKFHSEKSVNGRWAFSSFFVYATICVLCF